MWISLPTKARPVRGPRPSGMASESSTYAVMYGRRQFRYQATKYQAAARAAAVARASTIHRSDGLHSNGLAQGMKAFEATDAGLTPSAFAAVARQAYEVPFARPSIWVDVWAESLVTGFQVAAVGAALVAVVGDRRTGSVVLLGASRRAWLTLSNSSCRDSPMTGLRPPGP